MSELELKIHLKDGAPTLIVTMNVAQFEIFIKQLPNMEKLYKRLVDEMLKTTTVSRLQCLGEKQLKAIIASEILKTINSGMPREKK